MFLADYLQNEIKTSSRAFPWKGCGRRRRGQPGRALLHLNLGCSSPSFCSPQVTAALGCWTKRGRQSKKQSRGWVRGALLHPRTSQLHVRPLLPPKIFQEDPEIFWAGKTPNRLPGSRSPLSEVLLKRGEPICIFPPRHGGMFLVTLFARSGLPQACS